jgi:capsular exopolysaccharide synthesis family protein
VSPPHLLVVTSPSPGDGKTTTAINLAITLAERGRRTLLVDSDLRRGTVGALLGLERSPGLTTILVEGVDPGKVMQQVTLEGGAKLDVLTTGMLPDNPAVLLATDRARRVFQAFRDEYEVVVIDSPPVNVAGDAAMLGSISDGVLIVARAGVTASQALTLTMEQLRAVRAPILGGVLNDVDFDRDITYDGTYRYAKDRSIYAARSDSTP